MNWRKIKPEVILKLLREMEETSPTIDGEYAVVYTDGKEELTISYKKLESAGVRK